MYENIVQKDMNKFFYNLLYDVTFSDLPKYKAKIRRHLWTLP